MPNHRVTKAQRLFYFFHHSPFTIHHSRSLYFGQPLRHFGDPLSIMLCVFQFSIVHPHFGHHLASFGTAVLHNLFGSPGKSGNTGMVFPGSILSTSLLFSLSTPAKRAPFILDILDTTCAEPFRCSALAPRERIPFDADDPKNTILDIPDIMSA